MAKFEIDDEVRAEPHGEFRQGLDRIERVNSPVPMARWISIVAAALIGTACAPGSVGEMGTFLPAQHYDVLRGAKLCCSSYSQIQYAKLTRGAESRIVISTDSPVAEFDGRRSFFAAFELPTGVSRLLVISTVPMNMRWNPTAHVLVPAIQFLDAAYRPISLAAPGYQTKLPFIGGPRAEARVSVPNDAHYAVLIEGTHVAGLGWRDSDRPSGVLFIRRRPTGEAGVLLLGG